MFRPLSIEPFVRVCPWLGVISGTLLRHVAALQLDVSPGSDGHSVTILDGHCLGVPMDLNQCAIAAAEFGQREDIILDVLRGHHAVHKVHRRGGSPSVHGVPKVATQEGAAQDIERLASHFRRALNVLAGATPVSEAFGLSDDNLSESIRHELFRSVCNFVVHHALRHREVPLNYNGPVEVLFLHGIDFVQLSLKFVLTDRLNKPLPKDIWHLVHSGTSELLPLLMNLFGFGSRLATVLRVHADDCHVMQKALHEMEATRSNMLLSTLSIANDRNSSAMIAPGQLCLSVSDAIELQLSLKSSIRKIPVQLSEITARSAGNPFATLSWHVTLNSSHFPSSAIMHCPVPPDCLVELHPTEEECRSFGVVQCAKTAAQCAGNCISSLSSQGSTIPQSLVALYRKCVEELLLSLEFESLRKEQLEDIVGAADVSPECANDESVQKFCYLAINSERATDATKVKCTRILSNGPEGLLALRNARGPIKTLRHKLRKQIAFLESVAPPAVAAEERDKLKGILGLDLM
jgi:hypothetical protein